LEKPHMSRSEPPQTHPVTGGGGDELDAANQQTGRTFELREEQLVAHTTLRDVGDIEVRTVVEDVPGRLEVDAYREEVVVEHETVGSVVSQREDPREEDDDTLIIPIYEEQLVVTKRLVLRERLHVRRIGTTERQLYQDTLRRERLVVEDPQNTGLVRERYPDSPEDADDDESASHEPTTPQGGLFEHLVRKALE
jgi:uncharacterized protein (TIGR02271 family)